MTGTAGPSGARRRGPAPLLLAAALALLLPAAVQAQEPSPSPPLPPIARDEKDFEGFTSLAVGSGARAFGMGGAFLARADDATAASWNPAGLSYLRKPEISLVGVRNSFLRGPEGAPATDHFAGYTPDFASLAHPLDIGPWSGAIQLSYQRVFSFKGERTLEGTDIPPRPDFETVGRGGYDVLALGTGFKISRTLRVGATFNYWLNGYHQDRTRFAVPGRRPRSEQEIEYSFEGFNWNANFGVIWSPSENLNLGLVGKTAFSSELRLRRDRTDFDLENEEEPISGGSFESPDDMLVRLDFPGAVGFGVSYRPRATLTVSADYTRTFWSRGRIHNFFILVASPNPDNAATPITFPPLLYPTLDDPEQTDTEQFRLGFEYVFLGSKLKFPLRGGAFSDRQYFRSATGPPPTFAGVTAGAGVVAGPLLLDVAYIYEWGSYTSVDDRARVTTRFQRFFASLIYRHGR